MNVQDKNNTLFSKIKSRNKSNLNLSLKKKYISFGENNNQSSLINNTKNLKNLTPYEDNKSTKIYTNSNFTKSNLALFQIRNFSNTNSNKHKKSKFSQKNEGTEMSKNFLEYDKNINFLKLEFNKKMPNNNTIKYIKKEENDMKDKICLLPKNFSVKNFSLKTSKIFDYLGLNKDNKFFILEQDLLKYKKKENIFNRNKTLNRAKSVSNLNNIKKIEEIYPTIFNIEGKKNRKILQKLELEDKRKKKNEKRSSIYFSHNFNLKRKMLLEKSKAEEEYNKIDITKIAQRRKLLLLLSKIYQKDIFHLRKKNSFVFHLDLPLYNFF